MAGDWIKMTHSLCDKPEVRRIARMIQCDVDTVVGKLHRFWCWIDDATVDGVVDGVVSTDVDDIVRKEGFADALESVGWVSFDGENERLEVPNFDSHNGQTAKKRGQKNKRQAKWRKAKDGGVDDSASTSKSSKASTREEKRRVKKNNKKKSSWPDDKPIPEDWIAGAREKHGNNVDWKAESERFLNNCAANGRQYVDWKRAWWNWCASPYDKTPNGTQPPNGEHKRRDFGSLN